MAANHNLASSTTVCRVLYDLYKCMTGVLQRKLDTNLDGREGGAGSESRVSYQHVQSRLVAEY